LTCTFPLAELVRIGKTRPYDEEGGEEIIDVVVTGGVVAAGPLPIGMK
jgi:hypothetical protein